MSVNKSKSASSQASSSLQQDNKIAADGGSTAISGTGGNVVINQSDMGLISTAFDYFTNKDAYNAAATNKLIDAAGANANNLIEAAGAGFESIFSAGAQIIEQSQASAGALLKEAGQAANPSGQQSRMEMMLIGLAALFLLMNFKGAK